MIVHCSFSFFSINIKKRKKNLCANHGSQCRQHYEAISYQCHWWVQLSQQPKVGSFNILKEQRFHCCCGLEERRRNVNDSAIPVSSVDWRISALQGIFGLGRQERLKGMRVFADPVSPSLAWVDSSRDFVLVCQESFPGSDVLRGWVIEVLNSFWVCTQGPALKQGRPLDGGGSCLAWLAEDPAKHAALGDPPAPPSLGDGCGMRLWRRGGGSVRGQVEPADLGATGSWVITARDLHPCCAAHCCADAGLSFAVISCGVQERRQGRLVRRRWVSLSGSAAQHTSATRASAGQSSARVASSDVLSDSSLWPSMGRVLTGLSRWEGSMRQGLKGCSIWGCKKKKKVNIYR